MSHHDKDPKRVRAANLGHLGKALAAIEILFENKGSVDEGSQLLQRLHERYTAYLQSHEEAVAVCDDDEKLFNSHIRTEKRYEQTLRYLTRFLKDGITPGSDDGSYHAASALSFADADSVHSSFLHSTRASKRRQSVRSQKTAERSSRASQANSEILSQVRVQAGLEEVTARQMQEMQETELRKMRLEFERQQLESKRQQLEMETKLRFEFERQQLEMETKLREQKNKVERLKVETHLRQKEMVHAELGDDYHFEDEREDVTKLT
jgi:flagellar biosynthesis GTPase FlhF